MKRKLPEFLCGIGFGAIVFLLNYVMIPLLCRGWPDLLWIGLMIAIPAAVAWLLYRNHTGSIAIAVFPAMLVQYLLLIALAQPVSRLWGCSVTTVLGWPEYIGSTFLWPIAAAVIQAVAMYLIKKWKE